VGILHVVIPVPYQLKVRYHPNALSVGRQFEILSGFLNVEGQRITVFLTKCCIRGISMVDKVSSIN